MIDTNVRIKLSGAHKLLHAWLLGQGAPSLPMDADADLWQAFRQTRNDLFSALADYDRFMLRRDKEWANRILAEVQMRPSDQ